MNAQQGGLGRQPSPPILTCQRVGPHDAHAWYDTHTNRTYWCTGRDERGVTLREDGTPSDG